MIIIRENTEGEYSGLEHAAVPGVVESLKVRFLVFCSYLDKVKFRLLRATRLSAFPDSPSNMPWSTVERRWQLCTRPTFRSSVMDSSLRFVFSNFEKNQREILGVQRDCREGVSRNHVPIDDCWQCIHAVGEFFLTVDLCNPANFTFSFRYVLGKRIFWN